MTKKSDAEAEGMHPLVLKDAKAILDKTIKENPKHKEINHLKALSSSIGKRLG